jgi:hypothetical protein
VCACLQLPLRTVTAQEVEATTSSPAEMTLKLACVSRWAVTGTPIGHRGLSDLYGLFVFLDIFPFIDSRVWKRLIEIPFKKGDPSLLLDLIREIWMRRSDRDPEVLRDRHIPPLTEHTVTLRFSPLESEVYEEQKNSTRNAILRDLSVERLDERLSMKRLDELRRLCCHPLMNQHNRHSETKSKVKTFKSMEEISRDMAKHLDRERHASEREFVRALISLSFSYAEANDWGQTLQVLVEALRVTFLGLPRDLRTLEGSWRDTWLAFEEPPEVELVTRDAEFYQWKTVEHTVYTHLCVTLRNVLDQLSVQPSQDASTVSVVQQCNRFLPYFERKKKEMEDELVGTEQHEGKEVQKDIDMYEEILRDNLHRAHSHHIHDFQHLDDIWPSAEVESLLGERAVEIAAGRDFDGPERNSGRIVHMLEERLKQGKDRDTKVKMRIFNVLSAVLDMDPLPSFKTCKIDKPVDQPESAAGKAEKQIEVLQISVKNWLPHAELMTDEMAESLENHMIHQWQFPKITSSADAEKKQRAIRTALGHEYMESFSWETLMAEWRAEDVTVQVNTLDERLLRTMMEIPKLKQKLQKCEEATDQKRTQINRDVNMV